MGARLTGFFPGLGSRNAYRNLGRGLLDAGGADIYREAATALAGLDRPEELLLVPENRPRGAMAHLGFIGAAFLVHNLALEATAGVEFSLYTGESFGIIASAVAAGSLSVGDGVRVAHAFTPLMMVAAEGGNPDDPLARQMAWYLDGFTSGEPLVPEPSQVVGLIGPTDDLAELALSLGPSFAPSDVEVHKLYSPNQVNVYVRTGARTGFDRWRQRWPRVVAEELKPATTFLAHSARMHDVRRAFDHLLDTTGVTFSTPRVPIVSNSGGGLLTTAIQVRSAVLAIVDEVMASRTTVETLAAEQPDAVIEVGLGEKSLRLLRDNQIRIPLLAYTGTASERALIQQTQTMAATGEQSRDLEHELVVNQAHQRNLPASIIQAYIGRSERLTGFGKGGSESMTLFLRKSGETRTTVRKILSETLTTADWDQDAGGVMLPPFAKAKKQAEFLRALPDPVRSYFPEVLEMVEHKVPGQGRSHHEVIYEMTYVPGEEVSRFVERYSPPPAVVARTYEEIFRVLAREVHAVNRAPAPDETLDVSYFTKIEDRLALCRATAPKTFGPDLLDSYHIVINGTRYLNHKPLLRRFRDSPEYQRILEPRMHALVMGDTNTENIKLTNTAPLLRAQRLIESGGSGASAALNDITAEMIGIRFLDPRAIGFQSAGPDTRDDPMYDNKPWHNSLGHYDEIHYEHFTLDVRTARWRTPAVDITFTPDNPYQKAYRVRDVPVTGGGVRPEAPTGVEDYFAQVMTSRDDPFTSPHFGDDPYWLPRFVFLMGTHFTAMPPFHFQPDDTDPLTDAWQTQRRPVAIYCEGVKWLNWALEILEGSRTEFLGVPVPPLPHLRMAA